MPFVVWHCLANLRVREIPRRVCAIFFVPQLDDSREKSMIQHGSLTLCIFGGLRESEFVEQLIVDQLCPIDFAILHRRVYHPHMNSRSLIMAGYFASKALVEVVGNVAPLSSHSTSFDCVGDFPSLVIPFIGDFVQELD